MVVVMQDPLDTFNITFGLHSQEVTAKTNKQTFADQNFINVHICYDITLSGLSLRELNSINKNQTTVEEQQGILLMSHPRVKTQ